MNQLPPDDPNLSEFLRRYRPAPPSGKSDLEDYLLARIEQDVQTKPLNLFWVFSSAIIAGVILGWGTYRYTSNVQMASTGPELEHFILDNWGGETVDASYTDNNPSVTRDWLLLTSTNATRSSK